MHPHRPLFSSASIFHVFLACSPFVVRSAHPSPQRCCNGLNRLSGCFGPTCPINGAWENLLNLPQPATWTSQYLIDGGGLRETGIWYLKSRRRGSGVRTCCWCAEVKFVEYSSAVVADMLVLVRSRMFLWSWRKPSKGRLQWKPTLYWLQWWWWGCRLL